jgi:RHS repeat-associated protein
VSSSTNRITTSGFTYDASGNLTSDGTHSPSYDAEGHTTSIAGVTYYYDGDGKRVRKSSGTLYWYGTSSDPLLETDGSGNLTKEYIFFGGKRIASRDSSSNVSYYFADHLGTARVVTNASGTVQDDSDFYPYGGERVVSSGSGNHYKFTGKERDSESGLDNFGARYDSSQYGRFMSPDPIFITKHRIVDPQQWNRYAYVRNNPLILTDPTGKDLWETGCGANSNTCNNSFVGTWDKDHTKFTPTTIQSDANGNFQDHKVTMTTSGIVIDGKYQGVFASGTAATVVNGTGNMSGFQATFNSNCLGHCEASGTITALAGHSFNELLPHLRGPNEKLDVFSGHEGDQYRGGNTNGPDVHISYLADRDSQSMHFDWAFPFGSVGGFAQHSKDFIGMGIDKYVLFQQDDPPYHDVSP